MNILLLGGTGAMGMHLVKILDARLHSVYVTSRKRRQNFGNVKYLLGNAHDRKFIDALLLDTKFDAIVDFMYYTPSEFSDRLSFYLQNTSQYVCISSSRVYSETKSPITEQTPRLIDIIKDEQYLEGHDYSLEKCQMEDIVMSSEKKNWTMVRPYITYSESRLQLGIYELSDWYYRVIHGRTVQLSKHIAGCYTTLTYGYDVALGIAALIGQKDALGNIYHITCSKPIKWIDVLKIYADEIYKQKGIKIKIQLTSKDIFKSVGVFDAQVVYDRLYNRIFNNSKINNYCEVQRFNLPTERIRHCIRTFITDNEKDYFEEHKPNWWRQSLIDRLTGEYAQREEFSSEKEYQDYLTVRNDKRILYRNRYYSYKQKIMNFLFKNK